MADTINTVTLEVTNKRVNVGDLDEDEGTTVSGIALGIDDVTVGQSGNKKFWPADTLRDAAPTMAGKPIVTDHNNDSDSVVGQVTKSAFKDDVGVIYEGVVFDESLAEKISQGLLEVSIRGYHGDPDEMETTDDGAAIIDKLVFDNLSIVPDGASPSNTLDVGEHAELERNVASLFSGDDVSAITEEELNQDSQESEDSGDEYVPSRGDYVGWNEDSDELTQFGQIISNPNDTDEVEVLPYDDNETVFVSEDRVNPWHTASNSKHGESDSDSSEDEDEDYIDFEKSAVAHNERVDEPWKETTPDALRQVFTRGMNHAEDVDPKQNAMARLNAFFFRLQNKDTFEEYDEDDDLLNEEHPKYNPDASGGRATGINRNLGEQISNVVPSTLSEIYRSKQKATQRAKELGLDGYHELSIGDSVVYMPGEDHKDFIRELGKDSGFVKDDSVDTAEASDDEEADDAWMRDDSLSLYDKMCRDVGVDSELLESVEELNPQELYDEFHDAINMDADTFEEWSEHPCANKASIKPVTVRNRVEMLLETDEGDWGETEASAAKRVVSFIARMRGQRPDDVQDGPDGCPSKWAISLMNWGYNPFDELPPEPDAEAMLAVHMPDYRGLDAEGDWSGPDFEDFREPYNLDDDTTWQSLDMEMRRAIGEHFVYSASGFPADNYTDMKFPVVHPDGTLSLQALRSAKQMITRSTVPDEEKPQLREIVNDLAKREFDKDWNDDDSAEMAFDIPQDDMKAIQAEAHSLSRKAKPSLSQMKEVYRRGQEVYDSADPEAVDGVSASEFALERVREYSTLLDVGLPNDDNYTEDNDLLPSNHPRKEPMSTDELTQIQPAGFRDELGINGEELGRNTSDTTMTEDNDERIEELEATVEELESRNDELLEEVESVRREYAEALAGDSPFDEDELIDKFTVEELRQKYDEYDEAQLASAGPAPEAGDAGEAELSNSDEETEERIAELEAKAENYESMGWTAALEETQKEIEELRN